MKLSFNDDAPPSMSVAWLMSINSVTSMESVAIASVSMGNEVCGGGGGAVDGAGAAIDADVAADDDDDDDDGVGAATLAVAMTGGVGVPALLPLLVSLILISICKFTLSRIEMESSKLIIICVDLRKFCLENVLLRKKHKKRERKKPLWQFAIIKFVKQ